MPAFKIVNRRSILSTGISVVVAGASFLVLPKVYASNSGEAHDPLKGRGPAAWPLIAQGDHHKEDEMRECIEMCQDCHALCTRTIKHCLDRGGRHSAPGHIRLLVDCAQMCEVNIDYMLRGSLLHQRVCGVCAEACKLCGESCGQLAVDDQLLKQCVNMCRRCAESCEHMASQATA